MPWANILISSCDSLIKGVVVEDDWSVVNDLGSSIPSGTTGTGLKISYITTNAPLINHNWAPEDFTLTDFYFLQQNGWDEYTSCSFSWMLLEIPNDFEEAGDNTFVKPKVTASGSEGLKIHGYTADEQLGPWGYNNLTSWTWWTGGSAKSCGENEDEACGAYVEMNNQLGVSMTDSGSAMSHVQIYYGASTFSIVSGKKYRVRFKATLTGNSDLDRPIYISFLKNTAGYDHYHDDHDTDYIIKHGSTARFYERIITANTTASDVRLDFMVGNGHQNALYDAFTMTLSDIEVLPAEAELNTTLNANTPILKYSNVFDEAAIYPKFGIYKEFQDITDSRFVIPEGKKWVVTIQPYKAHVEDTDDNYEGIFMDGWTAAGQRTSFGKDGTDITNGYHIMGPAFSYGYEPVIQDIFNMSQFMKSGILAKRIEDQDDGTLTVTNFLSSGEYDWLKVKCSKSYVGFKSANVPYVPVQIPEGSGNDGNVPNPDQGIWTPSYPIGEVVPAVDEDLTHGATHIEYTNKFLILIFEVNDV